MRNQWYVERKSLSFLVVVIYELFYVLFPSTSTLLLLFFCYKYTECDSFNYLVVDSLVVTSPWRPRLLWGNVRARTFEQKESYFPRKLSTLDSLTRFFVTDGFDVIACFQSWLVIAGTKILLTCYLLLFSVTVTYSLFLLFCFCELFTTKNNGIFGIVFFVWLAFL